MLKEREMWYHNLKEKYPNGVWCEVWDETNVKYHKVVIEYHEKSPYPFETLTGNYPYARPLTKEEAKQLAPEIIDDTNLKEE